MDSEFRGTVCMDRANLNIVENFLTNTTAGAESKYLHNHEEKANFTIFLLIDFLEISYIITENL